MAHGRSSLSFHDTELGRRRSGPWAIGLAGVLKSSRTNPVEERPITQYCEAADRVSLAYLLYGDGALNLTAAESDVACPPRTPGCVARLPCSWIGTSESCHG